MPTNVNLTEFQKAALPLMKWMQKHAFASVAIVDPNYAQLADYCAGVNPKKISKKKSNTRSNNL